VVKCNVPKRGWINGVGGCPNVGGICIAARCRASRTSSCRSWTSRREPGLDQGGQGVRLEPCAGCGDAPPKTADKEPKWRRRGDELLTGAKRTW
jgi:hydrogenase small subunit